MEPKITCFLFFVDQNKRAARGKLTLDLQVSSLSVMIQLDLDKDQVQAISNIEDFRLSYLRVIQSSIFNVNMKNHG